LLITNGTHNHAFSITNGVAEAIDQLPEF